MPEQNELLDRLRDLHMPPEPLWWPPAPGWWLLASVLIGTIMLAFSWHYARRHRQRESLEVLARQARAELDRLRTRFAEDLDARHLLSGLSALIRQVAMTLGQREEVARLTGCAWLTWLDQRASKKLFTTAQGRTFAAAHYQKDAAFEVAAVLKICEEWLGIVFTSKQDA